MKMRTSLLLIFVGPSQVFPRPYREENALSVQNPKFFCCFSRCGGYQCSSSCVLSVFIFLRYYYKPNGTISPIYRWMNSIFGQGLLNYDGR